MQIKKMEVIATRSDLMLQIFVDKIYEPHVAELDGELDVEITRRKKPRSLNANSYMWVLCDRIAKVVSLPKEDVYREAVKQVGVYDDIAVTEKGKDRLIQWWHEKGLGWFAEDFGESKVKGASRVRVYYGSSVYSQEEMSRLVDFIVGEASELGIEVMTPRELEELKNKWGDV